MLFARPSTCLGLLAVALCLLATPAAAQTDFITFESGQVRPLLMTPDGNTVLALNTPDNTLEIFDVGAAGLVFAASVPVGMEPVAVAARKQGETLVLATILSKTGSTPRMPGTRMIIRQSGEIHGTIGGGPYLLLLTISLLNCDS